VRCAFAMPLERHSTAVDHTITSSSSSVGINTTTRMRHSISLLYCLSLVPWRNSGLPTDYRRTSMHYKDIELIRAIRGQFRDLRGIGRPTHRPLSCNDTYVDGWRGRDPADRAPVHTQTDNSAPLTHSRTRLDAVSSSFESAATLHRRRNVVRSCDHNFSL